MQTLLTHIFFMLGDGGVWVGLDFQSQCFCHLQALLGRDFDAVLSFPQSNI